MAESIVSSSPPPYDTSEGIAVARSGHSTSNQGSTSSSPNLPPNPAPIVLSWSSPTVPDADVQLHDPHTSGNVTPASPISQPSGSTSIPTQPSHSLEPFGRPPGYVIARTPTTNIVYSFSHIGDNAMILIPPYDAPDTRPKYHISVRLNCFIPSSYITTIRRGATQEGAIVGDFEMGISDKTATLFIRGKEFPIGDVLGKSGSRRTGLWDWKFVKYGLFWDCKKNPRKCFSSDRRTLFATFMPVTNLRQPGIPTVLPQLEVTPQGQPFFDDILMSVLIIERWRLTPATGDYKQLFN
ncbi:uncharacterized protein EV420DRAFT_968344 [Desarmillaria tabescens]|uniref:Uncharacterized protein n=1 Tax=Armillaria tabescens TaxID=1929756 RepID=A0AA39NH94_ARMTA|nr:uncharacterized protein EV420DRAFT_968344 [Desarmillaria tabescens]KAK0465590.1 hypothetical protein EV420DRAFT_968344 [Desarmillaria tabescens]